MQIDPTDSTRTIFIGAELTNELREELITFLKENIMNFAWSHVDMIGINPETITYKLNVNLEVRPGLASQYSNSSKKEWKDKSFYRLH